MAQIDGGHLVARMLAQEGVKYIFTLCGGHISPIYEGCADEGIGVIDVRHEQAAAHAAEGWAKVTGQPGVAVVTAGPGVTDTVTAVANAFQAPSPMILIGGRSPLAQWEMGALQEIDHVEFLKPITRWARAVLETRRIPEYLSIAFRHACAPKPGPAFLEIPMDVLNGSVEESQVVFPNKYRTEARPQGDPDLVEKAAELLLAAQRPVAIGGGSIWRCQASGELRQFIEMANVPVFLNGMGRGSVPPDHPLFFSYCRNFALGQADVVLISGAPFDFRLGYGRPPAFHPDARVIQIELDATDIGRNRAVEVGIVGDVKHVLRQLTQEYSRRAPMRKEPAWVERLKQAEARIQQAEEPYLNSDAVPIHPLRLCKEVRNFLDRDATVIGDGGEIVQFASRVLAAYYPGHWLDPGQLGCLGVGTGFAMAAKLARPDKQVLIMNGDGSFGLNAMEFDTMVRHCLPVVSVIGNDGAWGQMKHGYLARYGRCVGVELAPGTRYDKMVGALGGYGEFVERPEDIRPALERAFASERPACVNVITDPDVSYGGVSRQRREAAPPR